MTGLISAWGLTLAISFNVAPLPTTLEAAGGSGTERFLFFFAFSASCFFNVNFICSSAGSSM